MGVRAGWRGGGGSGVGRDAFERFTAFALRRRAVSCIARCARQRQWRGARTHARRGVTRRMSYSIAEWAFEIKVRVGVLS